MASFQRNRVSPYRSSQGVSPSQDGTDGDAGNGNGSKRRLPCNRANRGCVALEGDNITSPETELTSYGCSSSRPLEEPMHEPKQMTTVQAVGAASHTSGGFSTAVRIGSKPVSSRSASF